MSQKVFCLAKGCSTSYCDKRVAYRWGKLSELRKNRVGCLHGPADFCSLLTSFFRNKSCLRVLSFIQYRGRLCFLNVSLCLLGGRASSAQAIFPAPPENQKLTLQAHRTATAITLDGLLHEPDWQLAPVATNFRQAEPKQGNRATCQTVVRVLYDSVNLYIGAMCYDSLGRKGLRVQDLRRDFSYGQNELFSVSFDPFRDVRTPIPTFQVTPFATQRDLLILDDRVYDTDWDARWDARTTITDSGYVVEMAIPWASLRYPAGSSTWGLNFNRNIRRLNQITGWSPWPRAYTVGRMAYAGLLTGLVPPTPALNLRVQPYALLRTETKRVEGAPAEHHQQGQVGGEVKWALTPNTVLEATVNTDFAQADADRQVLNLSRSSLFLPERRQFFLENASLLSAGENGLVQPFFSRRIGLDETGGPLPLAGGLRLVSQTAQHALGGLVVRQRAGSGQGATTFGVGRYVRNLGPKLRLGTLGTLRLDEAGAVAPANVNGQAAVDGFVRLSEPLYVRGMVSLTYDRQIGQRGVALFAELGYSKNWFTLLWQQACISAGYRPGTGFVARTDVLATRPSLTFSVRPPWLPASIRFLTPQLSAELYQQAASGALQEATVRMVPLAAVFQNGAGFSISYLPSWQVLATGFEPVPDVRLAPGHYRYHRVEASGETNQSARFAAALVASTGSYYNGHLTSTALTLRAAPLPQVAVLLTYIRTDFGQVGELGGRRTTHLLAPEARLALNPRVQLMGFYQYNTAIGRGGLNVRFSWQYQPLSFVYVVVNEVRSLPQTSLETAFRQQSSIVKLSYLRQF